MPYKIIKKKGKCRVQQTKTGKFASSKWLPCKRAQLQLRAIYSALSRNGSGRHS